MTTSRHNFGDERNLCQQNTKVIAPRFCFRCESRKNRLPDFYCGTIQPNIRILAIDVDSNVGSVLLLRDSLPPPSVVGPQGDSFCFCLMPVQARAFRDYVEVPVIPSMDGMLNDLRGLTDQRLLATLHDEVKRERHITLRVLLLLIVVEQRRLHIDRYSSLFAYCTDQLKYSGSAAGRRIAGARCLRDYPRAWPMLFDGRLNLTTLCIIARVITPENADELLDRSAGGTQRQVEDLAAQYGGPKPVRDRIKPVRSLGRSPRPVSQHAQEPVDSQASGEAASQAGSEAGTGSGTGSTAASQESAGFWARGGLQTQEDVGANQSPEFRSGSYAESAAASRSQAQFGSGAGAPLETAASSGAGVRREATAGSASGGSGSTSGAGVSSETATGFRAGAPNSGDTSSDSSARSSSSQSQYGGASSTGSFRAQNADEPLTYEIIFRADAAFVEKLRRLQALLSTDPNPPLAPIFNRAIELALDRYDPERRQARRELRRTRRAARTSDSAVTPDPPYTAFDGAEINSEKSTERISDHKSREKSAVGNDRNTMANNDQNTDRNNDKSQDKDPGKNPGKNKERKNKDNSGKSCEKLSAGSNDQNTARSNDQNNARSNEQNNARSNAQNNEQNNEQNNDAISGKNERTHSVPSRTPLPRRAGMTPRPKIPQWLRDQVVVRDGHRCTHIGSDGRCPAVTELEIDHLCPHSQGGSDHIDNLRTLCRAHNQRAAEIVFGVAFMRRCRGESPTSPEMNPSIERAVDAAEFEAPAQMESVPV